MLPDLLVPGSASDRVTAHPGWHGRRRYNHTVIWLSFGIGVAFIVFLIIKLTVSF